ncbi:Formyltransferase [Hypoxylon sp. NC0597]|nr:Formyltransferase [Hypoxylon sp. NC0597]
MQRLTRQFVTRASRLSPWLGPPNSAAGAEALLLCITNPLLFQPAAWKPLTTLPGVCRRCQIRSFRIPASLRSKEETIAKGKRKKKSDPLQILFCGSDEFSDASLLELFREHVSNRELIRSIDVVVRPGKPTGRGNKVIQYPTTREVAKRLDLPIHERNTFTGWDMPSQINLIIAVSFGLFVPRRLLRQAKYGGLNLHPSYLPDLRGPAPLQHAILAGRSFTGVTLQTLDAAHFDHGLVLARSRPVLMPDDCEFEDLLTAIKPIAADLLVQGLRDGVHVPPLEEAGWEAVPGVGAGAGAVAVAIEEPIPAPKVTTQDRQILPSRVPDMQRRNRALGPLWFWSRDRRGARKRVIVDGMWSVRPDPALSNTNFVFTVDSTSGSSLAAETLDQLKAVAAAYASASKIGRCTPYLVPLEAEAEADVGAGADHKNNGQTKSISSSGQKDITGEDPRKTYMVLWIPEGKTKGYLLGHGESCYVGLTRFDKVKVEGDARKPAAQALKNFIIPVDLDGGKDVVDGMKEGRVEEN